MHSIMYVIITCGTAVHTSLHPSGLCVYPGLTGNPVILTVKENLEPIKKAIWDARVKWRDIGGGLKVPYDTLEEIRYNRDLRHDGERLEVVLCHWIRTDKATINDLLKVLSGKVVHRNDLANRVTALQEEEERIGVGLMAPKVLNQPVSKGMIFFTCLLHGY